MLTKKERAAIVERLRSTYYITNSTLFKALTGEEELIENDQVRELCVIARVIFELCNTSNMIDLGDYELCPGCDGAFKTSDIEIVDMQDGDYDYGVCPHCGVLLKLRLVPTYYFEPEFCSVEEFEREVCVKLSEEQ